MGRKRTVTKHLNEEKENNNPCLEYANSTSDVATNCPLMAGQKRPIELVYSNTIDNKEIEIINLKKQCIDLKQRVEILEKACLLIPQHITSIENFFNDIIQISNNKNDVIMLNNNDFAMASNDDIAMVSNGDVITVNDDIIPGNNNGIVAANNNDNTVPENKNDGIVAANSNDNILPANKNDDIVAANNNDTIVPANNDDSVVTSNKNDDIVTVNNNDDKRGNVMTIFNIDDATLNSLKKETSTSTARSILKYLYPNPEMNFKLSNMNKVLNDAIIDLVQKAHPNELTTTAKIKHAMSNYFGLLNYRKKMKSTIPNKRV
ncbi:unnamed protein product [Rotaria sordida]|uniref:BEN domain-containing protein n=1 Tax=Rotaria sordida TaxID=392033 RepID=A0A815WQV1_9BILA|nr:unnamed protein product [Rotaria sordida]CAF1546534.1 unnamed protein product [Rotaria sordida]